MIIEEVEVEAVIVLPIATFPRATSAVPLTDSTLVAVIDETIVIATVIVILACTN